MKSYILLLTFFFTAIFGINAQRDISEMCSKSKIRHFHNQVTPRISGNQNEYNIGYYKMNLEVLPNTKTIKGEASIYCKSRISNLDKIDLDLTSSLVVTEVKSENDILFFEHKSDLLTIHLKRDFAQGEIVVLLIKYSGKPAASMHFDTDNNLPWIWTQTEPYGSLDWFPCKNLPDDKIDSMDVIVSVPLDLIVASNGNLTKTEVNGDKTTYFWKEKYPIASYLVSIAIHPYQIRTDYYHYGSNDSMPVINYILPSHFAANNPKYSQVPEMISALATYFGEYPFVDEKYGNAEFPWGGGMEHQTVTSLIGPYEYLLVHELGHQWWGDMITCRDFHHIWLNEGFATYTEALWAEYKGGKEALFTAMKGKESLGHGTIYVDDITNSGRIFDSALSYRKASWVLHMLRHIVGDDAFFQILKTYGSSSKKYDVATTEDFRLICEQVSQKNLSKFFDQWIYGDFHPVYLYEWSYKENNGDYELNLDIEQFQIENLFAMPIDISILTENGEESFVIDNNKKLQSYIFNLNSKPLSVELDKDNWILKEVKKGINLINHNNSEITLSISTDGSIGFSKPNGLGNGLIYPIEGKNSLFFGTFMFGNSDSYVVDNSEKDNHKDFQKSPNSKIEIDNSSHSDLDISVKYTDSGHPNSKNISVNQTSYSWNLDPNRDFIIFKYDIINNGSEDMDDFYAAQFLDFDIGDFLENYIDKDESNKLLYQYNNGIYLGIRFLNNVYGKIHFTGILDAVDKFDENTKYAYLSGENNEFTLDKQGDWSSMLSIGPYKLKVGDTLSLSFAIVGGMTKQGLIAGSEFAQDISDDLFTIVNENYKKENLGFVNIYPNPVIDKVNMDLYLENSQEINISIFDITGKIVYSDNDYYQEGFNHLKINRPISQGLYFYKISSKKGVLTGKIVK